MKKTSFVLTAALAGILSFMVGATGCDELEASFDCDTWEDLSTARARIREHGHVLDEWITAAKADLGIDPEAARGVQPGEPATDDDDAMRQARCLCRGSHVEILATADDHNPCDVQPPSHH
jgi:hypothetical protein